VGANGTIGELRLAADVNPAAWVVAGVRDFEHDVGSQKEVRWSEVAAANGRVAHPAMEWVSITGDLRYYNHDRQPGLWDEMPTEGSLPHRLTERLTALLGGHTSAPDRCWFAVWDGYGNLPFEPGGRPKVQMPQRPDSRVPRR
jgi:hypothetical protein